MSKTKEKSKIKKFVEMFKKFDEQEKNEALTGLFCIVDDETLIASINDIDLLSMCDLSLKSI